MLHFGYDSYCKTRASIQSMVKDENFCARTSTRLVVWKGKHSGKEAKDGACCETQDGCSRSDKDRCTSAVDHAAEQVAAKVVSPKQKLGGRWQPHIAADHFRHAIRRNPGRKDGDEKVRESEDEPD